MTRLNKILNSENTFRQLFLGAAFIFPTLFFGQSVKNDMGEEFAILYFKAKKAELTKSSMRTLDSLSIILKKRTTAHISIVTKSGDLCDMCGARDWDRTNNIATYFVSKGVSEERLSFNVFSSTGDNDKIEIRVFDKSDSSKPAPHPVLKRNQK